MSKVRKLEPRKVAPSLHTPTDLSPEAVKAISKALNILLADTFALYLKTKNFHWHVSGPHFRDYHLLLDEQAEQIFAATDDIAERVRKLGATTLRSVGQVAKLQRVNRQRRRLCHAAGHAGRAAGRQPELVAHRKRRPTTLDEHGDIATASLLENWIDEAERRVWFLFEATRTGGERAVQAAE